MLARLAIFVFLTRIINDLGPVRLAGTKALDPTIADYLLSESPNYSWL